MSNKKRPHFTIYPRKPKEKWDKPAGTPGCFGCFGTNICTRLGGFDKCPQQIWCYGETNKRLGVCDCEFKENCHLGRQDGQRNYPGDPGEECWFKKKFIEERKEWLEWSKETDESIAFSSEVVKEARECSPNMNDTTGSKT